MSCVLFLFHTEKGLTTSISKFLAASSNFRCLVLFFHSWLHGFCSGIFLSLLLWIYCFRREAMILFLQQKCLQLTVKRQREILKTMQLLYIASIIDCLKCEKCLACVLASNAYCGNCHHASNHCTIIPSSLGQNQFWQDSDYLQQMLG